MPKGRFYSLKYTPETADSAESRLYWRNGPDAIEQLHSLLDDDVIFISLDMEGFTPVHIDELGLAMLDTRHMLSSEYTSNLQISARHIFTRSREIPIKEKYLHFSRGEHLRQRDLAVFVKNLFYIEDIQQPKNTNIAQADARGETSEPETTYATSGADTASKTFRNIVLVGHGIRSDLREMHKILKLDVKEILPIVAVIDTDLIGQAVFETESGSKLVDLLNRLGCPSGKMHVAGNDAMFTMKALLAMAIRTHWKGSQRHRRRFERFYYAPIPVIEVLDEKKLENNIAANRALYAQDRKSQQQRKQQDWTDLLESPLNLEGD